MRLHLVLDRHAKLAIPDGAQMVTLGVSQACIDVPPNTELHEIKGIVLSLWWLFLSQHFPEHEERIDG